MKAVALCEVTHGSAPIQGALDYLAVEKRYRIVGAALVAREVPPDFQLDVPIVAAPDAGAAIRQAAAAFDADVVIDLTAGGPNELFAWATEALHLGLEVHGADFRLWPPSARGLGPTPALAFLGGEGTPARAAAICYFVREAAGRRKCAAVVLDPGAPLYPEVIEPYAAERAAADLLGAHRDGRRISADHYRLAAAAGITAVGCSFAGPGLTGLPVNSLVPDGILLAREAGADLILLAGSGRAIPPAVANAECFLADLADSPDRFNDLPFSYQIKQADFIVATGYEATPDEGLLEGLHKVLKAAGVRAPLSYACLEPALVGPEPAGDAVVITARRPETRDELTRFWKGRGRAQVVGISGADEFPPRGDAGRVLKRGSGVAAVLDLAAPDLGAWLVHCDHYGIAVYLYYETLKPARGWARALLAKAGFTAAETSPSLF